MKATRTRRLLALLTLLGCLAPALLARAQLIRDVRASQAKMKGFGYVLIEKKRWCIILVEAEMMEASSGRPIGETYFGSLDATICKMLWKAAQQNYKVDIAAFPEKAIVDPLFLGSVKKIYKIGYAWVRVR